MEEQITAFSAPPPASDAAPVSDEEAAEALAAILRDLAAEEGCTFLSAADLYQDFTVRCRMRRLSAGTLNMTQFHRRFAEAYAGLEELPDERREDVRAIARAVPDDLLTPFLVILKAAAAEEACPDDEALARAYGTSSPGRIRRLLDHFEKTGLIVVRTDFGGRRTITVPQLGATTAAL